MTALLSGMNRVRGKLKEAGFSALPDEMETLSVSFDDSISERDLRKAKNRQKMAGGFRKESGQEMYCSIMTMIETLKKNGAY